MKKIVAEQDVSDAERFEVVKSAASVAMKKKFAKVDFTGKHGKRKFEVKIILAHLGHPYEGETVAVIRKHANLYADISALFYRPWQFFHSLMLVHEYNVWEQLLFGTDYPVTTVAETVSGLRSLCDVKIDRFSLPRDRVEALIHRDALGLLGLPDPRPSAASGVGA